LVFEVLKASCAVRSVGLRPLDW